MITLQKSTNDELVIFDEMDRQRHAVNFVNQIGLDTHREWFETSDITYLTIMDDSGATCGYFILVAEPNTATVEFRRILIDKSCCGLGQEAIAEMENYSIREMNAQRIWLDVYEDNAIGRIREKITVL